MEWNGMWLKKRSKESSCDHDNELSSSMKCSSRTGQVLVLGNNFKLPDLKILVSSPLIYFSFPKKSIVPTYPRPALTFI
jgi:hypothetical protein